MQTKDLTNHAANGHDAEFSLPGAVSLEAGKKKDSRIRRIGSSAVASFEATRRSKFARRLAAVCVAIVIVVPVTAYAAGRLFVKGGSDELSAKIDDLRRDVDHQINKAIANGGDRVTQEINSQADSVNSDLGRIIICNQKIPDKVFRRTVREGFDCADLEADLSDNEHNQTIENSQEAASGSG